MGSVLKRPGRLGQRKEKEKIVDTLAEIPGRILKGINKGKRRTRPDGFSDLPLAPRIKALEAAGFDATAEKRRLERTRAQGRDARGRFGGQPQSAAAQAEELLSAQARLRTAEYKRQLREEAAGRLAELVGPITRGALRDVFAGIALKEGLEDMMHRVVREELRAAIQKARLGKPGLLHRLKRWLKPWPWTGKPYA